MKVIVPNRFLKQDPKQDDPVLVQECVDIPGPDLAFVYRVDVAPTDTCQVEACNDFEPPHVPVSDGFGLSLRKKKKEEPASSTLSSPVSADRRKE